MGIAVLGPFNWKRGISDYRAKAGRLETSIMHHPKTQGRQVITTYTNTFMIRKKNK